MPLLILVCDDQQLATDLERTLLKAIHERLPLAAHCKQRELRSMAQAVCTVLNIYPDGLTLVQLLGGHEGMTNLQAITKWCKANVSLIDGDLAGPDLIDALAQRLHAHLISKMH